MNNYAKLSGRTRLTPNYIIPVTQKIDNRQIVNSTGGYGFQISPMERLKRFLILGSEYPTYYATGQKLSKENADNIISLLKSPATGVPTIDLTVRVSLDARAPKNDSAIFVLALATAFGDSVTKAHAFRAVDKVCRTGTHILHFTNYCSSLRGWGRGLQKAVASWFNDKDAKSLAYQVTKYRQRDGWSMRDVLRVSHPKQHGTPSETHQAIYHYLTKGWDSVGDQPHPDQALQVIWSYERAKQVTTEKEIAKLVRDYKMPWEFIDTKWLNSNLVWESLLENIKPEALTRNLGRLSANGFIKDFGANTKAIVAKLTDQDSLQRARLHPFKVLTALKQYQKGHGDKGSLTWKPNQQVVNALDEAFYLTHKFVEPTNRNILVAIDVSGSMDSAQCAGLPMTARDVACAIGMTIAKTEPSHKLVAISSGLTEMAVSPRQRLDDVIRYASTLPFQSTDLSLPILSAMKNKWEVDAFVTITDNEINSSSVHPCIALEQYRQFSGRNAKNIVIGVTATNFTIAKPEDINSLDICGMDTNVPAIVADFIRGALW